MATIPRRGGSNSTYVDFDVEVLEVEGVFPDIDADDGDVSQQRVLVGRSDDFQLFSGGIQALYFFIFY